jgi:hypothetical protein
LTAFLFAALMPPFDQKESIMRPLFIGAALLLSACQSAPTPTTGETLYINSQLVHCVGVGPMQCMQVRSDEQQAWTLFYQQIEGFQFEPGYQYQLTVSKEQLTDVPADAPSLRYRLIKLVSKQAAR